MKISSTSIGGGSDIINELSLVRLKVQERWKRRGICSETVKRLYLIDNLNTREIAAIVGFSKSAVLKNLKRNDVEKRHSHNEAGDLNIQS